MELSVREWMIIIGVLLIVAVLLDGYRRVRNENRHRIKVSLSRHAYRKAFNPSPPEPVVEAGPNPELPGGGARVIRGRSHKSSLQLDKSVPVLLESVQIPDEPEPISSGHAEIAEVDEIETAPELPVRAEAWAATQTGQQVDEQPEEPTPAADDYWHVSSARADEESVAADPLEEHPVVAEPLTAVAPPPVFTARTPPPVEQTGSSLHEKRIGLWDEPDDELDDHDEAETEQHSPWHGFSFRRRDPQPVEPVRPVADGTGSIQEVLSIYVVARDGSRFKGQDLLQLLLACDLRFGKMNIFHRHEKSNGRGAVQFSVANIAEPGTFDLDRIEEFSTAGVCLFLTLPGPEAPYQAFDYMVETAQVLVKHLDGELRDDAHSALTRQTLEHCRQRIRDFERKQLTLHL